MPGLSLVLCQSWALQCPAGNTPFTQKTSVPHAICSDCSYSVNIQASGWNAADLQNYIQAPEQTSALNGGLLETWAPLGSHTSGRFAWLSAAGLQHGRLRLDLEQRPPSDIEYLAMEPEMITLADSGEQITHMVRTLFTIGGCRG